MDEYAESLKREFRYALDAGLTSLAATIRAELDRIAKLSRESRESR